MSTLSVATISGVTTLTGGGFDQIGASANSANVAAIASMTTANLALTTANLTLVAVNLALTTANAANITANYLYPTGIVINYASRTTPAGGWLPCDGSIYSRSTYGALANVIGTPASLSTFTAEYANTNAQFTPGFLTVANGVAFLSNVAAAGGGPIAVQYSGGIYTSTDGTTWTARTAHRLTYSTTFGTAPAYTQVTNGAFAANVSGGIWVVANSSTTSATTTPNNLQTSSDLITWTNRSIDVRNQTGTPTGAQGIFAGIAGGGTLNRLVYLHMKVSIGTVGCCGILIGSTNYYVANTATSDDAGATFSYSNNLPAANAFWWASIASSNAGFVISQGNSAFWSANGQYWSDISANLRTALNISSISSDTTQLFYNSYSANGQFIIPAYGNRFLVAPSSNGSNGNWATIGPTEGLYNPSTATTLSFLNNNSADCKLVHNGQCFVLNYNGAIYYSSDLKYWFRDVDFLYPSVGSGSHLIALGTKFLQYTSTYKTVFSFTANGAYTAATQFPVPRYSTVSMTLSTISNDSSATPLVSYIKT